VKGFCKTWGRRWIIHGQEGIAAFWRDRLIESPALDLDDLHLEGGAVVVSYRTSSGIVWALLDISENGLITRCRCGPV
jgi:hypothetical protein